MTGPYHNDSTKCVDCGSEKAKWWRIEEGFAEPAFLRLCDACLLVLANYTNQREIKADERP